MSSSLLEKHRAFSQIFFSIFNLDSQNIDYQPPPYHWLNEILSVCVLTRNRQSKKLISKFNCQFHKLSDIRCQWNFSLCVFFIKLKPNHFFSSFFSFHFHLIENYCREHRCANQYCISRDLVCDGVNHCGDNSDEHYYVHCQGN